MAAIALAAVFLAACAGSLTPAPGPTGDSTAFARPSATSPSPSPTQRTATLTATTAARTATPRAGPPASPTATPTATSLPRLQLPAGLRLLYAGRGDLWLWDGAQAKPLTKDGQISLDFAPLVSPDGARLLVATGDGAAIITLRDGRKTSLKLAQLPAPEGARAVIVDAAWLPSARRLLLRTGSLAPGADALAAAAAADDYWLADATTGALTPVADLDGVPGTGSTVAGRAAISPDGRKAAVPAADGLILLNLDQGTAATLLSFESVVDGGQAMLPVCGWAADARTLYAATPAEQGARVAFWEIDARTAGVLELGRLAADVVHGSLTWSPGGEWIAWVDREGLPFVAPGDRPTDARRWAARPIAALLAWSADGRAAAAAAADGSLLVLDAAKPDAAPALDFAPPGGRATWQAVWWQDALIATARRGTNTVVVVYQARAGTAGPGPVSEWGLAPVAP